jgi:hypothetical protein
MSDETSYLRLKKLQKQYAKIKTKRSFHVAAKTQENPNVEKQISRSANTSRIPSTNWCRLLYRKRRTRTQTGSYAKPNIFTPGKFQKTTLV